MKRIYRISLILLSLVLLSGCETVSSLHAVGDLPVKTPVEQWQGSWLVDNDGVIHTKVLDAEKGELLIVLVNIERQDKREWLETHNVFVRKTGNNYYFNLAEKDNDTTHYFFAKFIRNENSINVYLPSHAFFSRAVKGGKVSDNNSKDRSAIVLKGSASEINAFIESNQQGFVEKDIVVLKKVGK